ncbi:MAG: G5 domain-containing protein, partial [Streptococcus salivarius]
MKQANHVFEKVTKYAIRKLSVGVGPVAIGTFLLAGGFFVSKPVSADQVTKDATVHMAYVAENELTAEEQQQVVHAIPEDYQNEDTFYLVYKRKGATQTSLPQTGSSDWVASGLGLATATMAVLLFSKKHRKKIIGLVLIGAAGQSLLVPIEVLALQNKELQAYNQTLAVVDEADLAKGVIAIDGYEYVGYLRYSAKPELEQPLENTLQGLESSIKEETTVNQGTADKDSEGISWKKGTQESGHEGEALVQPANPEYTEPISAKGTQEVGHEGEALVQPVAPEYTGPISANGTQEVGNEGEAVVQPANPAYTGSISSDTTSANGTQEVGHEGEAVVQPVNPAYTGSINSDTTSAKGTQESGHEGEALVQPENPVHTPVVGSITETETQAIDYPIEVITDDNKYMDEEVVEQEGKKGSQEIQKIYQTIDGVKVGEPTIVSGKVIEVPQPRKIRRGSKPLDGTTTEESIVELPFKEIVQEDDSLEKGTLKVVQEGQKGQNKITKVYKTYKGNKTSEAPTVTETVLVPVQDRIVRK